jgi:hypothetical protein
MQYAVMLNKVTRQVVSYIELTVDAYAEGQLIGDNKVLLLPDRPVDTQDLLKNKYYKDGIFKELPHRENEFTQWDYESEQWVEPPDFIQNYQAKMLKIVDQSARDKILLRYPIYRQLNFGREPSSQEAVAMYAYIDSIRNESNITNEAILNASNKLEIETHVSDFDLFLSNI